MRKGIGALTLMLLVACHGVAGSADLARLRKSLSLPTVSVKVGIHFSTRHGFSLLREYRDLYADIAAMQKALQGNAGDISRLCLLGDLYYQNGDNTKAREVYQSTVALCQQQLKTQPGQPRLLAQLGEALAYLDQAQTAEASLREAVRKGANDWWCWFSLARFLNNAAMGALLPGGGTGDHQGDITTLVQSVLLKKPRAEEMMQAKQRLEEAYSCLEKSILLVPQEPRLYLHRAMSRAFIGLLRSYQQLLQGEKVNLVASVFSAEVVPDLRHMAYLNPNDYRALGLTVLYEFWVAVYHEQQVLERGENAWQNLPRQARQSLEETLGRLEQLTRSQDASTAAGAAEILGVLQMLMMKNLDTATAYFRLALNRMPTLDSSWELLSIVLVDSSRLEEFAAVCQGRLRYKDSVRGRMMLAKACEKMQRFEQAEEAINGALRLAPENLTANLALTRLLLRRSIDATTLAQAGRQMERTEQLVNKEAASQGEQDEVVATRAVYLALRGDPENARQILARLVEKSTENHLARHALKVLEE